MKLNAPTQITFIISFVLAVIALLSVLGVIAQTTAHSTWIALVAYAVLAAGTTMKGM